MTDQFDNLQQTQPLINKGTPKFLSSVSFDQASNPPKTSRQASNYTSPQRTTSTGGKSSKGSNAEKKKPIREDLSIDQIDELFESFSLFDKDYDGAINREELSVIMKSIGLNVTDLEINEMIDEVDTVSNLYYFKKLIFRFMYVTVTKLWHRFSRHLRYLFTVL
jgi:hypothetical protein